MNETSQIQLPIMNKMFMKMKLVNSNVQVMFDTRLLDNDPARLIINYNFVIVIYGLSLSIS
jgi:hypothetical protein